MGFCRIIGLNYSVKVTLIFVLLKGYFCIENFPWNETCCIYNRGWRGWNCSWGSRLAHILYELHVKLILGEAFSDYSQVKHCSWNSTSQVVQQRVCLFVYVKIVLVHLFSNVLCCLIFIRKRSYESDNLLERNMSKLQTQYHVLRKQNQNKFFKTFTN